MTLASLWFFIIGILWMGFFVLEGFDFGVGMLHRFVGGDDHGHGVAITTIGPVWDGNEVWLIVAGAGIFAAFPDWYSTMFSGFYLALVVVLLGLIVRGVSIEFRGRGDTPRWRATWSWLLTIVSVLVPLLLGCALANLLRGLPINAAHEYTGSFWDLLSPYCLFAGITILLLCLTQGSTFLALKTRGEIRDRSRLVGNAVIPLAALALAAFALWTWIGIAVDVGSVIVGAIALLAVISAWWFTRIGRDGWAFTMSSLALASAVLCLFLDLYPNVMVSSTNPAFSLTVDNASSSSYTLTVMSIVTLIFFPIVLLYQGWTFWVFRRRLDTRDVARGGGSAPDSGGPSGGAPSGPPEGIESGAAFSRSAPESASGSAPPNLAQAVVAPRDDR